MSISPQWTIQGEAGKRLDATTRSFASLNAFGVVIDFPDLGTDTCKFSIRIKDLVPAAGDLYPEEGQKVTVYRSGTRFFQGRCTSVEQEGRLLRIVVSGVGWDMDQEPLTSTQTDSVGATAERMSYAFPSQSLTTSLQTIITTAAAKGVPIAVGSLASTFAAPQISLKQMSCGAAAADIIRLTPDLMGWVDYSPTTPTFNTARRKSATVRTLAAGDIESIRLRKETSLKVDSIKVAYVTRGTDGRRVFAEQISGDAGTVVAATSSTFTLRVGASSNSGSYVGAEVAIKTGVGAGQTRTITAYNGATRVATISSNWTTTPNSASTYQIGGGLGTTGTRQVHVVSGEEIDTFLPNDYFDSVQLRTLGAGADISAAVRALDSGLASIAAQYGTLGGSVASSITYYSGFSTGPKTASVSNFSPVSYKVNGAAISVTGKYLVYVGDLPDWLTKSLGAIKADLSCTYVASITSATGTTTFPNWFLALGSRNIDPKGQTGGYASSSTSGPAAESWIWWAAVPISVPVWLINTSYASLTTVYRPADYSFVNPPNGFASGMQESNGFDVYSGELSWKSALPGGSRYRGTVINLTGHRTEFETMKACVRGETLDLDSGVTTISVGAPPRFSYRSFMDRIRSRASDNVVYLT